MVEPGDVGKVVVRGTDGAVEEDHGESCVEDFLVVDVLA